MKAFILFVLLIFTSITYSQNVPHLFELKGLEDSLGNTHLFYRYGGSSLDPCWSNSIYHLDIQNNIDTLFVRDVGSFTFEGCYGISYLDYEFFNSDPAKFIFVGLDYYVDPWVAILLYDVPIYIDATGSASEVEVSKQNEDILYLLANDQQLFKSTDGGYSWTIDYDSLAFIDYAMISLSKNDDTQIYGINDKKLVRSEDEGHNYIIVDTSEWSDNTDLFYDADGQHIYGMYTDRDYLTQTITSKIFVSNDNGNPFTWLNTVTHNAPIRFAYDNLQSGEVYYSLQKDIYKSTDYANTFKHYRRLDRNITGLYKKSGSNILYVSTQLNIYEITPDSIQSIKSLPIPVTAFKWYPLSVGNKWIYDITFYGDGDSLNWISIVDVESNNTFDNKVYTKVLITDIGLDSLSPSEAHYEYFRTDSSDGKIYRAWFDNDSLLYEELKMDLLAEVGDTIPVGNGIYLESEVPFSLFGFNSLKRTFLYVLTPIQDIRLLNGIGLIYEYWWELAGLEKILLGTVINGVVYGDTTVVSVEDETPNLPTEFSLSQNYPNPFNPSTKIKYALSSRQYAILKVYDVLGNEIATLVNEEKPAGEYEVEFNPASGIRNLVSGIYFYQLRAGSFVQTRKMLLLK